MKVNLVIARFPWHGSEHPDVTDYLMRLVPQLKADPRIGELHNFRVDDTPITMSRNRAVKFAQQVGADYMLMVDADMAPDLAYKGAKPFWESSFEFAVQHPGPCLVAAPYCGPPPCCNIYIFKWCNWQNHSQKPDMRIEQFMREEAAQRAGFEEVAALPTGLILIDMRVFKKLKPPFFYYEWEDETESAKASTEDVTFTRDVSLSGSPVYCNWDAWAGHWKPYRVEKPTLLTVDKVRHQFIDAIRANVAEDDKIIVVGEGRNGIPSTGQALAMARG